MDHENAPGNMGLLDQNMALKWVYENIHHFGGDNSKITIFGESAGSASTSFHLLSPLSHKFFKSVIMQSGGFLAEWATLDRDVALKRYTETLEAIGCYGTASEQIECLKKADAKHIMEKSDEYFFSRMDHGIMQFPFIPVVDNYFLEETPLELVNKGKFKKCPIMLGVNRDEANWFYVYNFEEYRNFKIEPKLNYDTYKVMLNSLFYYFPQFPTKTKKSVLDAIIYKYSYWDNVQNRKKNIEYLDDAAADYHFSNLI
jgi:carboxylesterase type B